MLCGVVRVLSHYYVALMVVGFAFLCHIFVHFVPVIIVHVICVVFISSHFVLLMFMNDVNRCCAYDC